jgi:hypothetical protein
MLKVVICLCDTLRLCAPLRDLRPVNGSNSRQAAKPAKKNRKVGTLRSMAQVSQPRLSCCMLAHSLTPDSETPDFNSYDS